MITFPEITQHIVYLPTQIISLGLYIQKNINRASRGFSVTADVIVYILIMTLTQALVSDSWLSSGFERRTFESVQIGFGGYYINDCYSIGIVSVGLMC